MVDGDLAEISFEVPEWPPLKNEALSMLAAGHPQSERVHLLLASAAAAAERANWICVEADIALEVVVRAPASRPPGDATNFLGGIADVLQDKTIARNIDLSHLGDLQSVGLYRDDRQIREITYRTVPADSPSYSVRIRALIRPGAEALPQEHSSELHGGIAQG